MSEIDEFPEYEKRPLLNDHGAFFANNGDYNSGIEVSSMLYGDVTLGITLRGSGVKMRLSPDTAREIADQLYHTAESTEIIAADLKEKEKNPWK